MKIYTIAQALASALSVKDEYTELIAEFKGLSE
jgi:hypothetical protein